MFVELPHGRGQLCRDQVRANFAYLGQGIRKACNFVSVGARIQGGDLRICVGVVVLCNLWGMKLSSTKESSVMIRVCVPALSPSTRASETRGVLCLRRSRNKSGGCTFLCKVYEYKAQKVNFCAIRVLGIRGMQRPSFSSQLALQM